MAEVTDTVAIMSVEDAGLSKSCSSDMPIRNVSVSAVGGDRRSGREGDAKGTNIQWSLTEIERKTLASNDRSIRLNLGTTCLYTLIGTGIAWSQALWSGNG